MTKKVWTPHDVEAQGEISYKGNAHGFYALVHQDYDVKALEDAKADSEVLAELTRRKERRTLNKSRNPQCLPPALKDALTELDQKLSRND